MTSFQVMNYIEDLRTLIDLSISISFSLRCSKKYIFFMQPIFAQDVYRPAPYQLYTMLYSDLILFLPGDKTTGRGTKIVVTPGVNTINS